MDPGPGVSMFDTVHAQKKQAATIVAIKGASLSSKQYPVIMSGVFNSDLPT
jgi:hypothetical protein